ncbi:MAG: hypothetical protein M3N93_02880 [Acidobacteriota bacterium]|nr:hypothetical protein [Acidobacteriota bacterium]
MSWFPQIGKGSITQFPVRRTRRWRAISNRMENSATVWLPDPAARQIDWRLSLQDLTEAETAKLHDFFTSVHGQFAPFLFVDPMANLLGWSENLSRPDWQPGLMTAAGGVADPLGSTRASLLNNASAGVQTLQQTLAIPGEYFACFSAWMWSATPAAVTLQRDGIGAICQTGPAWKRFYVTGSGTAGAMQSTFSIALGAGQSIRVWGMQAEAQPYPSSYKPTEKAAGICEETYFSGDELTMTKTAVGLSSCDVALTSRI